MLQEKIKPDPATDWKIQHAIREAGELVDRLNDQNARIAKAAPHQRLQAQAYIDDLLDDIALIAARAPLTTQGLITLVTLERNRIARRGRPAPTRETSRTLLDRLTAATAAEAEAQRELNGATLRLAQAKDERKAAKEAFAAYGAKSLADAK